jgi:hypothetical protein
MGNDEDPFRIRCCESCALWRRHPDRGAGICMATMATRADMAASVRYLAAGNALNRCAHFLRLDDCKPATENDR